MNYGVQIKILRDSSTTLDCYLTGIIHRFTSRTVNSLGSSSKDTESL